MSAKLGLLCIQLGMHKVSIILSTQLFAIQGCLSTEVNRRTVRIVHYVCMLVRAVRRDSTVHEDTCSVQVNNQFPTDIGAKKDHPLEVSMEYPWSPADTCGASYLVYHLIGKLPVVSGCLIESHSFEVVC